MKKIWLLSFALFLSFSGLLFSDDADKNSVEGKCISGNCQNGNGTFEISKDSENFSGGKYVGQFKNGKFNGKGTLTWYDDRGEEVKSFKYAGQFKDGNIDGQGTFTSVIGYFDNRGVFKADEKFFKYIGEFKNGVINGKGLAAYPDGSKYVGEYKDGSYNGKGTFYNPDGSIYKQGRWENSEFKGE